MFHLVVIAHDGCKISAPLLVATTPQNTVALCTNPTIQQEQSLTSSVKRSLPSSRTPPIVLPTYSPVLRPARTPRGPHPPGQDSSRFSARTGLTVLRPDRTPRGLHPHAAAPYSASPKICTMMYMVLFSQRNVRFPSVACSQKHVELTWMPAPFFCTTIVETINLKQYDSSWSLSSVLGRI